MSELREIFAGETGLGGPALLELRPRWGSAEAITQLVDEQLRPAGYRLIGVFDDASEYARSILGFRVTHSTAWGRFVYVDDVSTVPDARGNGYADQLVSWVKGEAERLDCEAVHLDSGVAANRAAAHRLYMRHHLAITSHHFSVEV